MKKFILLFGLITVFACSPAAKAPAPIDLEAAKKEATAFIESQWEFMSNGSLEVAQKMFSKDAILIGTDKAEHYYGWEEMKASIEAQLALETPKLSSRNRNIIISEGGNMAAYTELIDFSFEMNGETMSIKDVRSSGVIQKIDGEWKIVQVHTSIGSEEQVVEY